MSHTLGMAELSLKFMNLKFRFMNLNFKFMNLILGSNLKCSGLGLLP